MVWRWAVKLIVVSVSAVIGCGFGALYYMSLTEGPFVGAGTEFEQPGYNAGDCYWSPEADEFDRRSSRNVAGVGIGMVVAVVTGALVAANSRRAPAAVRPAWSDVMVLAAGSWALAIPAMIALEGHGIRTLLDAGCVNVAVPGAATTVAVLCASTAAAVALGYHIGRGSRARRLDAVELIPAR